MPAARRRGSPPSGRRQETRGKPRITEGGAGHCVHGQASRRISADPIEYALLRVSRGPFACACPAPPLLRSTSTSQDLGVAPISGVTGGTAGARTPHRAAGAAGGVRETGCNADPSPLRGGCRAQRGGWGHLRGRNVHSGDVAPVASDPTRPFGRSNRSKGPPDLSIRLRRTRLSPPQGGGTSALRYPCTWHGSTFPRGCRRGLRKCREDGRSMDRVRLFLMCGPGTARPAFLKSASVPLPFEVSGDRRLKPRRLCARSSTPGP